MMAVAVAADFYLIHCLLPTLTLALTSDPRQAEATLELPNNPSPPPTHSASLME